MKKQFRRAGALMLALLMMMAAPALAEDAPSAADGTQIEEIIGEEPAVTEAPTGDSDGDPHGSADKYAESDGNPHRNADGNADSDRNSHGRTDEYGDSDGNPH